MGRKVHIICAKCGSDDIRFQNDYGETGLLKHAIDPEDEYGSGAAVYMVCADCSEVTSTDEWNDHNGKVDADH